MTAKAARTSEIDEDERAEAALHEWIASGIRPLSVEEQHALLKEAEDEFERGEGIPHEEAMRMIDAMIAGARH